MPEENQSLAEMMTQEVEEGLQQPEAIDAEAEQAEEVEQEPVNPEVEKALADGWVSKEEWVERGNDADDWVSAKKFNERGSMIGQIKSLQSRFDAAQKDFDRRLESVNKLHEAQQKALISDLEAKRDSAIEDADVAEARRYQDQIDQAKSNPDQEKPAADNGKPAEMVAWEEANPWINDRSPKASYAKDSWNHYISQGMTDVQEILDTIDADIAKAFPETNPRRQNAPAQESGRSKPGRRVERKLSWSDLTREEEKYYTAMPNAWKSKDEYLQTVADARKGA